VRTETRVKVPKGPNAWRCAAVFDHVQQRREA
jgi:hypothetical protein